MTETIETIQLKVGNKDRAADVLASAFHSDPMYRRLFPDSDERSQSLRRLFRAVTGYSLKYGLVHTTPSVEGVACWLIPNNTEITLWRMLRTGLGFQRAVARMPKGARQGLLSALAYTHEIHQQLMTGTGAGPQVGSHWYLWALGVEPALQGQGIAGKLIRPILELSDHDGAPCYLETQTKGGVAFYQKWGFEVQREEVVPALGIKVWFMVRPVTT